ncbi:MAG TPA: MBL fold metallo-hydrolase [Candidatus Krumholzibacteriaceae bacterium]|nr:MBL fold metallo-hydrolase [Candidatus Krumholzibacteriaceae bacterium]
MPDGKWWDILPRRVYSSLEKVETSQPWFDVYRLHDWLYALYEGGQYDEALMYLVIGDERAVVVDGGTGIGRLDLLVEELTDKPCFLLLTHTHNDHIGGCEDFDEIAVYDDAMSRESAAEGLGRDKMGEIIEGDSVIREFPPGFDPDSYYAPPYTVTRWLRDGDRVELGGRTLEVIHTPGHSSDHLCLLDRDSRYLWTGDLFYTGGVTTYLPGGDHDAFIESCRRLVDLIPHYDMLLPAHNEPLVDKQVLRDLLKAAEDVKAGKLTDFTEGRSVAVNYDIKVRRYRFDRFTLITRADI